MYLKKAEFNRAPLYAKFRLREPFKRPILSSDPSVSVHQLQPHDQFIIFASDGLWEHLSNQEAVDIVQNNPHSVNSLTYYLNAKIYFIFHPLKKTPNIERYNILSAFHLLRHTLEHKHLDLCYDFRQFFKFFYHSLI